MFTAYQDDTDLNICNMQLYYFKEQRMFLSENKQYKIQNKSFSILLCIWEEKEKECQKRLKKSEEQFSENYWKEKRRLTLSRLGKMYERTKKFNVYNAPNILEHHQLFPIPQSEIDANVSAVLEQNPGYN